MTLQSVRSALVLVVSACAWIVSWLYPWVFLPHFLGTCTQGDSDPWTVSLLIYLPIFWCVVGVALLGRRWARYLRWLSLPHAVTFALGLSVVWPYMWGTTIGGLHVCGVRDGGFDMDADALQRAWAPVQLGSLILLAFAVTWFWRSGRTPAAAA